MKLNERARAMSDAFLAEADARTVELVEAGLKALASSNPARRALGPGDHAPDFERPDTRGGWVSLSGRLADGPVVLSFFRGGWCPFCSLELRAWAEHLEALDAAGAQLIAISPEAPDRAVGRGTDWDPPFAVVTDTDQRVAEAYGLVFELPEPAQAVQRRLDAPLDQLNADGTWRLPVPATYVVDPDGTIRWAHAANDYTERAEPAAAIAALQAERV